MESDDQLSCDYCGEGVVAFRSGAGRFWRVRGEPVELPETLALPQCDHCGEFLLGPDDVKAVDQWLAGLRKDGDGLTLTPGEVLLGRGARGPLGQTPLELLDGLTVDRRGRVLRLQAKLGFTVARRTVEHVLWSGPSHAVATLRGSAGRRFLAVEVVSDGRRSRWLQATITELEWRGLVWSLVSGSELFLDRETWVVDYDDHGAPVQAWEFASGYLPQAMHAPVQIEAETQARLREVVESVSEGRTLRLGGRPVRGHNIAFDAYATVLRQVQDLVRVMVFAMERPASERARAELSAKSQMMVAAEAAGSVLVHIKPSDGETFQRAFAKIHQVFSAAESPEKLRDALVGVDLAVGAFNTLLTTARLMGLEFVIADGGDVSLVSTARAGRYQASFDAVYSDPPTVRDVEGFFTGFNHNRTKPTFTLQTEAGVRISGRISKELNELNFALDDFVVVGSSQWYRARVRTQVRRRRGRKGREVEHNELLRFEPLRGLLDAVSDSVPPAVPSDEND